MGPVELYRFLLDCVNDQGASALRSVAEFARQNSDLELKSPAVAALVCWEDGGLREIKNIAMADTTSKNISAALKVLAAVASGARQFDRLMFLHDPRLMAAIEKTLAESDLKPSARQHLNELVLSLPADDLLIPLGTSFMQISLASGDIAAEIVSALSAKWLRFGPPVVDRYEELLRNSPTDEPTFHGFFMEYPQLLDPMAAVVWSKPDFHGALEPDFVIKRSDNSYLIIEIECPGKSIVTQGNQLSADATQAERQGTEYRMFLTERLPEARQHFPFIRDPDCLIVIGMESSLTPAQRKALVNANASRYRLQIAGFDWLLERARSILTNVSSGRIEVISRHRMV
jgi:hypothetical protein